MSKESRKTSLLVDFNGADVSNEVEKYLISLTYTDCEADESDDLQIKIQDVSQEWLSEWLVDALTYLDDKDTASSSNVSQMAVATANNYIVNAPSGLNMRTGAGMSYSVVGSLPYGTAVKVTGTEGEWSKVDRNGTTVYMYSKYLSLNAQTAVQSSSNGPASASGPASAKPDVSSYPTLRYGSNGEYVKILQNLLLSHGQKLPNYGVDGLFRSETQNALIAFQKSVGINADGICGPITWAALLGSSSSGSNGTGVNKSFTIAAAIVRNSNNDDYGEEVTCGRFELDSVVPQGPPSTITIKGTALPYTSQIRQTKKNRAWESYTLSGIANEMAAVNGMSCIFESAFDPTYKRVEQYNESDIVFLSRLSKDAGLCLKVTNNTICLFDIQKFEENTAYHVIVNRGVEHSDTFFEDGSLFKNAEIEYIDCEYEKYKLSTSKANTKYAACKVSYADPKTGQSIEYTAKTADYDEKKNSQQLEYKVKVSSIAEAQKIAENRLHYFNRRSKTASFTLLGNPSICASTCVLLKGFGYWDGKYIVSKAKHTVSNSGYTTDVELRSIEGKGVDSLWKLQQSNA